MEIIHFNQRSLAKRWDVSEATLEHWCSEGIGPRLLVEKVIVSPNDIELRLRANGIERLVLELRQKRKRPEQSLAFVNWAGESNLRPAMRLQIVFLAQPYLVRFLEIPPYLSAVIGLDPPRCNLGQHRGTRLDFQATFQGNVCQDFNKIFCHGDCP